MLAVITKMDQMKKDKAEAVDDRIKKIQGAVGCKGANEKLFKMILYCSDVMGAEEKGTTKVKRVQYIDEQLCALWQKILDPSYRGFDRAKNEKSCILS